MSAPTLIDRIVAAQKRGDEIEVRRLSAILDGGLVTRVSPDAPRLKRTARATRQPSPARSTSTLQLSFELLGIERRGDPAAPRFTVTLWPDARRTIRDWLLAEEERLEQGHEVGGWLFAAETGGQAYETRLEIASASGPGPKSSSAPYSFMTDPDDGDQIDRQLSFAHSTNGGYLTGDWHVHPGGSGEPSPPT